jgi:glycerol kinase
MRGSITGLNLDGTSLASLALLYHATLTSIALQTRSIVDELNSKGHHIKRLYVSGSQAQNGVLMQLLADACYHGDGEGALEGVVVSVSDAEDAGIADFGGAKKEKRKGVSAVVLGAAMLGKMAHEMTQVKGEAGDEKKAEILWNIMVRRRFLRIPGYLKLML